MAMTKSTESRKADDTAAAPAAEARSDDTTRDPIHRIGARFPLRLLHAGARRLRAPHRIATSARYRGEREAI
jgi:hypothetical protein